MRRSRSGERAILAIAGIKVRLIMIHFMELGRAPGVAAVFEVWVVVVVLAIQAYTCSGSCVISGNTSLRAVRSNLSEKGRN